MPNRIYFQIQNKTVKYIMDDGSAETNKKNI